jgi:thiol-disulfide isomerase/thioredoxin
MISPNIQIEIVHLGGLTLFLTEIAGTSACRVIECSPRQVLSELLLISEGRAMVSPFAITTTDGQRVSLDGLKGKAVLIDSWATWCEPGREALPHRKEIAKKFQGQP